LGVFIDIFALLVTLSGSFSGDTGVVEPKVSIVPSGHGASK
jgi:hypothetical protein